MSNRAWLLFSAAMASAIAAGGCARKVPPVERVQVSNVVALRAAFGGAAAETSATPTAPLAEPTGWTTIKGSFKIDGPPPERRVLNVEKDHAVCQPGGKPVLAEDVVIDPATSGIKDVVIYLVGPMKKFPVGDPKWEHESYLATKDAVPEFDQKACVFLTHMAFMRSNQKMKVLNSDPVGHNANIRGGGRARPDNISVAANSYTFYEPGGESPEPFDVACSIHPWMAARMIVRDSPYVAVTKPDGTFEMPYVPAGVDLEFRVWQERAKFLQDVTVNGKAETWPKGRLKLKPLTDGQPLVLDVTVKAAAFNK
jgi:hypothetical protein